MSEGSPGWRGGRRAWDRLAGWDEDGAPSKDGATALHALEDIGQLRHLLDQAELEAVRTARSDGRSWAEIATKLGITRQSAWERWSDLEPAAETSDRTDVAAGPDRLPGRRAARALRRRATTTVPDVIGMRWSDACAGLQGRGLVAVAADQDAAVPDTDTVVTAQNPESGASVPPGTVVRLWTGRGGGAGVREPRRPRPKPRAAREELEFRSDEAVG